MRRWLKRNALNIPFYLSLLALLAWVVTPSPQHADAADEPAPAPQIEPVGYRHAGALDRMAQLPTPPEIEIEHGEVVTRFCDVLDAAEELGTTNLIVTVRSMEAWRLTLQLILIADADVCPTGWLDRNLVEAVLEHGDLLDQEVRDDG